MNSSEDKNNKSNENADQFEDLTRFLDEDFDTEDVDLFEFTTEEDSPLSEIKSIVLSLDWEISDKILHDLAREIERLKDEKVFQGDKVSQVYLQGLAKIGQYIESEGAQAHQNSIKLLLTFYYDFEKITSSETITGPEITALLKADVRKFKILQHQIAEKHGVETSVPTAEEARRMGLVYTDSEALRGIRAVILELDWEVSDEGLEKLEAQLDKLKVKFEDDRFIQILLQGLFTLKNYIFEERGRAHPEAYTLLHTFSEGIAKLIEDGELDEEDRHNVIVEQINDLNNLKLLIASSADTVEDLEEEAIEEIRPVGAEDVPAQPLDQEPTESGTESAELEPVEELEDLSDESLAGDVEIAPALSGEMEESEIKEEAPPEELAEKLEFFFGEDEKEQPPSTEEAPGVIAEIEEDLEAFDEETLDDDIDLEPALAGDASEGTEIEEEAPAEELAERLEFFFGADDDVAPFDGEEPAAPEKAEEDVPGLAVEKDEEAEAEEDYVPALSGSLEEAGFGSEEEAEEPPAGLDDKLEDLFGVTEEAEETAVEEGEEEEPLITPALADEAHGSEITEEAPSDELKDKLEYFFGEEEAAEETPAGDEEVLLTSALTEEHDEPEGEAARPMKTEEEYQAAVVQIRSHFKKLEASLREEIVSLQQEVEELREQLNSK